EKPTISALTLATEQDSEFRERSQLFTRACAGTTFATFPVRSFTLDYSVECPQTTSSDCVDAGIPVEESVLDESTIEDDATIADDAPVEEDALDARPTDAASDAAELESESLTDELEDAESDTEAPAAEEIAS